MRVIAMVLALWVAGTLVGCEVEDQTQPEPQLQLRPREQAQALEQKPTAGEAPQVFCNNHCDCQQGTKCGSNNTCISIPVFGGGTPPFPEGPSCVESCQCIPGRYCDLRNVTYGYCALL